MYPWHERKRMKSIIKYAGLAAIFAVMCAVVVLAQESQVQPLREIVVAPNGGIKVQQPGTTMQHVEVRGYTGPGVDGRGVVVFAPKTTLIDFLGISGNDDTINLVGDTRGFIGLKGHCAGGAGSKSLVAYTNATASNQSGPIYGAADGYAGRFIDYYFEGGVRLNGGVYGFERCRFDIAALGAVQAMGLTKANFTDCEWIAVTERHPAWPYWYQGGDACGVRVTALVDGKQAASPIQARLYFANCRLRTFATWADYAAWKAGREVKHTVVAADGPMLCRRWPTASDLKAGRTAYGLKGGVPASVFRSTPN